MVSRFRDRHTLVTALYANVRLCIDIYIYFIFYILYFIFYILYFIFYILYFIFYILYFIFINIVCRVGNILSMQFKREI